MIYTIPYFRYWTFIVVALFFLLLPQHAQSVEAPWYNGQWPQEQSDLKPDPQVSFGRLDNGFRYAIIPHAFPQGRVSLMLNVQAGSLMETDEELGYAHFVEHMAFNGSKNFKPGELIPFFQKHGMSFGGDTNAHTSFTETVYKLNLADNTMASMALGAKVLRDFADGLLFSEKEVQDELGVILSEKRSRDSESLRASQKKRNILFAGTRFVNDIIGTDVTLNAVTSQKLKNFYDRWYRPERMMLVVVGDIKAHDIETLATDFFADMKGRGEGGQVADWGEATFSGLRAVYHERPHDAVVISFLNMHKRQYQGDSKEGLFRGLTDKLAEFCMQQRLDRLRELQPDVWVESEYSDNSKHPMFPITSLTAVTTTENWARSLTSLSDSARSALQYGFTQEEMTLGLQQFRVQLEGAAEARKRMPSAALSLRFISATNAGRVFTSEEYDLQLFDEFAKTVNLEALNASFRNSFSFDDVTVYVTGPEKLLDEKAIVSAYKKAQNRPVEKQATSQLPDFPYLTLPKPASQLPALSVKKMNDEAHGPVLHSAKLANGTIIELLHYPVEEGKVQASILFGVGTRVYEDSVFPTLAMLNATLGVTGVGKLDSQQSQLLFGYRGMSIQEYLTFTNSVISGSGRTEDLELLLQAVWTQYKDPVISEKDRSLVVSNLELRQRIKEETVDGVSQSKGSGFFYGDALRFSDISAAMAQKVSLRDMQHIVTESRLTSPVKILIAGDFDVQKALAISSRLFGSEHFVHDRDGLPSLAMTPAFPQDKTTEIEVPQDPVAKSILRLVIHNDVLESDRKSLVERNLLAAVLSDRLRERLREEMGVIYGASVHYSLLADTIDVPGYGLFTIALVTGKDDVAEVKKAVDKELARLVNEEVTGDELERIRKPLLTAWQTERKELYKWRSLQLAEMVKGYPFIEWDNAYGALLEGVSAKELMRTANEVFKSGVESSLLIYSEGEKTKP